jgi:hypothetical protein
MKKAGITLFVVQVEVRPKSNALLQNCASSPAFFYDVQGAGLDDAFQAIAEEITRLRISR